MTAPITTIDTDVRALAAKTAAEIRRRGWVKGKLALIITEPIFGPPSTKHDCDVCLVGAVNAAAHGDPLAYTPEDDAFAYLTPAERELYATIADRVAGRLGYEDGWSGQPDLIAVEFNDDSATSVDHVLALLDDIAKLADTATQSAEAA